VRRAVLAVDVPSAAGRLDVVQVRLDDDGRAHPVWGTSALLYPMALADGQIVVAEDATGLHAGDVVDVELHG
jgi:molybdopterin molybdotransferase